nr:MAG TPA: hypothetical protein [Caudoviricetes sp.]
MSFHNFFLLRPSLTSALFVVRSYEKNIDIRRDLFYYSSNHTR